MKILADWDASPTFRTITVPSFQGQWFPTVWSLQWLWRHYASPKHPYVFTRRHGFSYRKTSIFMNTALKRPIHSQLNWAILLCDVIPGGKNWVNCAVLTGISAGLITVLSSRLSQTELRSLLRESHSFLSLPADTTMASSQGTSISSNSFSRWASQDIFLFNYHFLLHILRFLFFFSHNIMADVASKQQTTALFLSTIVTRTRRHTKLTNLMGNLCCARKHSVQFFVQFFLHS